MLGKPWGKGEGLLHGSRSLLQLACQSENRDLGWDQSKAVIYNTPHTAIALCIPTLHIPEVPRFLQTTPSVRDQEFKPMNDFTSKPQHFHHPSMLKPFFKIHFKFLYFVQRDGGIYDMAHMWGTEESMLGSVLSPGTMWDPTHILWHWWQVSLPWRPSQTFSKNLHSSLNLQKQT